MHARNIQNQLPKPIVRSSLTLKKSHQLFKSNNAVSNQVVQIVPSYPICPPIAAGTTLGICIIPVVALCCSTYVCCAVKHGVACCATHCTAIATLTQSLLPRLVAADHQMQYPSTSHFLHRRENPGPRLPHIQEVRGAGGGHPYHLQ